MPVTRYSRHLPHWRQEGATYFVTFRLADSLPHQKLEELRLLRREWMRRAPKFPSDTQWQGISRESIRRAESWLDQGMGSCLLRNPSGWEYLTDALRHLDGERYELGCFVVMPNHVHVVVRPYEGFSLETILRSWKGSSARGIRRGADSGGALWQQESFDRIVRDEEHLYRCVQYIGRNPELAGLPITSRPLWVRPQWSALGWGFEGTSGD